MVGKAVATMVCCNEQTDGRRKKRGTIEYLVESSQKDTTHESRKNYPETVFREDVLFISCPSRSGFGFLLHWHDPFMRRIRGREVKPVKASMGGIMRHGCWNARALDP
jgi:hypothetical protein